MTTRNMEKSRKASMLPSTATRSEYLAAPSNQKENVKFRNRHRLDPKNPFKQWQVEQILEEVITDGCSQMYYDPKECAQQCQRMAIQIRSKIKALGYDRCRLICVVDIIQKNLQSARKICSFFWDSCRDHYAVYNYNKFDLIATGYVFGIYKD